MYHGLNYQQVQKLAFEFAKKRGILFPQSWKKNKMAGKDWMYGFMQRHQNISLRSPEATSVARACGFNRKAVSEFYDIWRNILHEKKFEAHSIFNYDETGCTTVQNVSKVLAPKGMKQVGQTVASERGTLVTAGCCVSASGRSLPPALVFPRVNYKDHFIRGAPAGTLGLANQSGWMTTELFPKVLAHIIKHVGCTKEKPAVLLMDNHESHLSLEVVEMARVNGLSIVTFPPHCSHRLQPLDVSFYGPLKSYYKNAVGEWNLSNPGKRISIYDIPACFARAFNKTCTYENITSGFRKSEIFPLNSDTFTDADFLAATVFQQEPEKMQTNAPTTEPSASAPAKITAESQASTSAIRDVDKSFSDLTEIRPFPKRKQSKMKQRKRKRGYAKVLTSTPEKNKLIKSHQKKHNKKAKGKIVKRRKATDGYDSVLDSDDSFSKLDSDSDDYEEEFEKDFGLQNSNKELEVGDYIIVKLMPINSTKARHYVANIVEKNEDGDYEVQFFRQSSKVPGKLVKPNEEDTSIVQREDIVFCLPPPSSVGDTKRMQSMLRFPVGLDEFSCE